MRLRHIWRMLWGRKKEDSPSDENAAAPDYSYPRRQSHPLRTSFPRRQEGWHPKEAEHRTKERQYWRWSIGLTLVAVGGALASAWFAKGALKAGRDQAAAAVEGNFENNRAWIKVLGFSRPSLSIESYGAIFAGGIQVKNVGHSPAEAVAVETALVPDFGVEDPTSKARSLCHLENGAASLPFAPLVFPEDPAEISAGAVIGIDKVAQERDAKINWEFSMTAQVDREVAADNRRTNRAQPLRSAFSVVGCVTYIIPSSHKIGRTTFVYGLYGPCPEGIDADCSFELSHSGFYSKGAILLKPSLGGEWAD